VNRQNQETWARVLARLATRVRPELVGEWLADLELAECRPGSVVVRAPSAVHARAVQDHYGELIAEGFQEVTGQRPSVSVRARDPGEVEVEETPALGPPAPEQRPPFNPAFCLDGFVEGSTNRLAIAACRAIVDHPGELYNPLFINGVSGTGKTHLLQAVCQALSGGGVLYMTADEFSSQIASSGEPAGRFRLALRAARVLALDDVQTLKGREASQEELFHAFNSLYNRNSQLIFAADLPPAKLTDLPERLRSRFTWGLTVEIEPPLFENRLEILSYKAAQRGLNLSPEVLEELATPKVSSVRDLEGMLARITARIRIHGEPASREAARLVAADAQSEAGAKPQLPVSSERIQRVVASEYNLKPRDLLGPSRTRSVAIARHVAIYLVRQLTDLPIQDIGGHFGGRDHSTVNYAIEKIARLIKEDENMARHVHKLGQQLSGKHVGA
jgi:chromosomal replication initiator protein